MRKTKFALLALAVALFSASVLSAETTLVLDVAFGVRYVPPSNVTVPIGERVTIKAPVMDSNARWFKNQHPIGGAVDSVLVIPVASVGDAGIYTYGPTGASIPESGSQALILNIGTPQRFLNLSTRAAAGMGEQTLIAGFVVSGTGEKKILIRAIGPSLAKFGVIGFLPEPVIQIYDGAGKPYTDDYAYATVVGIGKTEAIAAATLQVGAFPLIVGSKDAVDLRPFPPGSYTIHVVPTDNSTGVVLMELYEVP